MRLPFSQKHIPVLSTVAVFALLYGIAAVRYESEGFFSLQVFVNFFGDNSFLGIIAVGMTFVILSGGIDLSVGSMLALSSILMALLMEEAGVPPPVAMVLVLASGTTLGFAMGIQNGFYRAATTWGLAVAGARVPITALVFVGVVAAGVYLSTRTTFGRNVYAVGGGEEAALLMGVPVGRTKVLVYGLSGFCSALAGIVYTLYGSSGDPRAGIGMELDAIAAVVVGGTLLSGGVGYVVGTLVGVLIFGIIQTGITFEGTLSSWWTRVAIGALLLVFILLQKLFARPAERAA